MSTLGAKDDSISCLLYLLFTYFWYTKINFIIYNDLACSQMLYLMLKYLRFTYKEGFKISTISIAGAHGKDGDFLMIPK